MSEYIKRKDVFEILQSRLDSISQMSYLNMDWHELDIMRNAIENAIDDVREVPTSDVRSVKYGKWIDVYTWTMFHEFKSSGKGERFWCSECEQGQKHKSNYCPCCGADMR